MASHPNYVKKQIAVDTVSWTAVVAPIDCQGVGIKNTVAVDLKVRTDSADPTTQDTIPAVMGQVARETGFDGVFLSALCDPEQGLATGCKVLRKKFDSMGGDAPRALLAWNGGANPAYAAQVLARRSHYL